MTTPIQGLRTLAVRLKRHQETALTLAQWLKAQPEVSRILFPPIAGDAGHALWARDFTSGCGLFGVVLKPVPKRAVDALMDKHPNLYGDLSSGGAATILRDREFGGKFLLRRADRLTPSPPSGSGPEPSHS